MRGCEGLGGGPCREGTPGDPRAAGLSPARPAGPLRGALAAPCPVPARASRRAIPGPLPPATQRRPAREGCTEGGGAPDPQHPRPGALGAGGGSTAPGQRAWVVPLPSLPPSLSPLTARQVWENPPSPLPVRGPGRQCSCTRCNSPRRKFGPALAGAHALLISASA